MQEKSYELEISEMFDICVTGYEGDREFKAFKQICSQFIKLINSQRFRREQDSNIHIIIFTEEKKNTNGNRGFILGCLLYLFIRYRSLKVMFEVYEKPQRKSIDREKSIILNMHKSELHSEFYNKICAFINKKQQQYRQSFNFFKEISFKTTCEVVNSNNSQILKSRLDAYQMISLFYEKLRFIMRNKKIYLMKNTISGYRQIKASQDQRLFIKILIQLRQIYCLVHVCINFPEDSLLALVDQQKNQIDQGEIQQAEQEQHQEIGVFKEFKGNRMQYLQKLVVAIKGSQTQVTQIIKFLQNTPNLSHLEIHSKSINQMLLPDCQLLLQAIIEHTPLIKKVIFVKFRIQNIEKDLLQRLYVNCPYLVDLTIGLTFQHSIVETYQIGNISDKNSLELERQKQIILYALRVRNITLNNSFQTVKLLLKKGYNFLSALEIIDCIEPICV